MLVFNQLLWSFTCIHVFWLYCFVTGTLVRVERPRPDFDHEPTNSRHHMAELVITSTTGIAITGFVLVLLGFIGLLNLGALLFWLALEVLLFKLIKHENVFAIAFWAGRLQSIKRAWSLPTIIIYFAFLLLSVPAILPPTDGDSVSYHLAYAVDWANAGRIYADEFLRFPYYANNFLLIYALMFVLKLSQLCHFATWLCGLLSGLGVYVLIAEDATTQGIVGRWLRFTIAFKNTVLPLTLALSPVFLKYVRIGYIDVPIGLFILVPVLCTYLSLKGDSRNYQIDLLLIAAFCIGMKITLFLCLPLFAFSLILVLRRQHKRISHMLALCSLLLLLSAPWYLRNFIVVGDPIPPVLNLMVLGRDRIWSQLDYERQKSILRIPKETSAILLLPINLFTKTTSFSFREPGTNLSVVLLYLPLATLFPMLVKGFRRSVGAGFLYLNIVVVYLVISWLGVSALARYFLHLAPVYLGYLGVCFNFATRYLDSIAPRKRVVALALQMVLLFLLLALPVPSPISKEFYRDNFQRNYLDLSKSLKNKEVFFKQRVPGYISTQSIVNSMYANGRQHQRVLAVGCGELNFYFRERNIVTVGDSFGPGRTSDLLSAIDNSEVAAYLSRFEIGAVLINMKFDQIRHKQYKSFVKQLEQSHFTLQPTVETPFQVIYLKTSD